MQYHLCTNLHARNLPSAPARSAVNRTSRVTTGHQVAQRSTKLQRKIETRFQQVCYPSPSFSLHRAPAAAAAFRSATARRAALSAEMRVSFSPAGRKRNGGRIPRFLERKEPHRPGGAQPPVPREGKREKNPRPERAQLKPPRPAGRRKTSSALRRNPSHEQKTTV